MYSKFVCEFNQLLHHLPFSLIFNPTVDIDSLNSAAIKNIKNIKCLKQAQPVIVPGSWILRFVGHLGVFHS